MHPGTTPASTSAVFTSSRYRRPSADEPRLSSEDRRAHGDGVPDMRGIFFVEQISFGFLPRAAGTDEHGRAHGGGRAAAAFVANLVQQEDARRLAPNEATPALTPSSEASSASSVCSLRTPEFFAPSSPFSKTADLPPASPDRTHLLPGFELPLRPVPELQQPPRSRQASAEPPLPVSGTATPASGTTTPMPSTPIPRRGVPSPPLPRPSVGPLPLTPPEMKQGLSQLMVDARIAWMSNLPLTHIVRGAPPDRNRARRPPQD